MARAGAPAPPRARRSRGGSSYIADRDESGARALSELKDRGINLAANALAQSTDHILSFFIMLRTELAFYIGCLNLHGQLAQVVGQFKRGKSSLMNAVIGRDLLPTGLLPLTSAITTLCYGPQERVALRRKGWGFEQEISLGDLADDITERGNPGNEKQLIEARVKLPVRFLRRGLHFIDTPGVGSARQENTATTYAFLPEADAVIFDALETLTRSYEQARSHAGSTTPSDAQAALDAFERLFDRLGLAVLILVALLSALFAPLVFLGGFALALLGMALWGIGRGAQKSVMRAAIGAMVAPDRRGTAYGIFNTGYRVSWFLGSALMGVLYDVSLPALILFSWWRSLWPSRCCCWCAIGQRRACGKVAAVRATMRAQS